MAPPYDDDVRPPLTEAAVSSTIQSAARRVQRSFYSFVEVDDLIQQAHLDMLEHPKKYARYIDGGSSRFLAMEISRTCSAYAQKEKASRLGYKPSDLFFYSKRALKEHIPAVLQTWLTGDQHEFEYPDRAVLVDVARAITELSASDYQMICWAFLGDPQEDNGFDTVGRHLSIDREAARKRVDRVLGKMQESLGGGSPFHRRRAQSNAASQAATRTAWDGEG
jgi:hypothetical protein